MEDSDHQIFSGSDLIQKLEDIDEHVWFKDQDGDFHRFTETGLKQKLAEVMGISVTTPNELVARFSKGFIEHTSFTALLLDLAETVFRTYRAERSEIETFDGSAIVRLLNRIEECAGGCALFDLVAKTELTLTESQLKAWLLEWSVEYPTNDKLLDSYMLGTKALIIAENHYLPRSETETIASFSIHSACHAHHPTLWSREFKEQVCITPVDTEAGDSIKVLVTYDHNTEISVALGVLLDNDTDRPLTAEENSLIGDMGISIRTPRCSVERSPDCPFLLTDVICYTLLDRPTGDSINDVLEHFENTGGPSAIASRDFWIYHRATKIYVGLSKADLYKVYRRDYCSEPRFFHECKVGPCAEVAVVTVPDSKIFVDSEDSIDPYAEDPYAVDPYAEDPKC